jgi:hypothetical protein
VSGRVVHCRREPYDIYIGRPGPWGNPFRIGPDGTREQVIDAYRSSLWDGIQAGSVDVAELASLHGRTLGCWCHPEPCHGDVLVEAAAWAHEASRLG